MLILLKVHTNTPNIRDFQSKTYSGALLQTEYTENSGYSMRFFRKIRKFAIIGIKLGAKPNRLGRKLRKIRFFAKTSNSLKSFCSTISCTSHNCRKHQKFAKITTLHNTTKLVRNSHLLSQKSGISSSATTIAFQRA